MSDIPQQLRDIADKISGDVARSDDSGEECAVRYCVIGKEVTSRYNVPRTWTTRREAAENHAVVLLSRGSISVDELLVVKVVSVVRTRANADVVRVA